MTVKISTKDSIYLFIFFLPKTVILFLPRTVFLFTNKDGSFYQGRYFLSRILLLKNMGEVLSLQD
jgi:hypothetical protein